MVNLRSAVAALCISSCVTLSAATRIDDPKTFVADVYRRIIASRGGNYDPPEDIYTARLAKLIRDDRRKGKGGVGCLDFFFWTNSQDLEISNLNVTSADQGQDRKTVTATFVNLGEPEEIRFDFVRTSGRWMLDDVHSISKATPWTLSEILKCTP